MIVSDAKGLLSILQWHLSTDTEPLALETWKAHIRTSGYGIQAGSMEWQITTLTPIPLFHTLIMFDSVKPSSWGADVQQICSLLLLEISTLFRTPKTLESFHVYIQVLSIFYCKCEPFIGLYTLLRFFFSLLFTAKFWQNDFVVLTGVNS